MDLSADIDGELRLAPMERALIPTGIAIALPQGLEAQIRPRSAPALKQGLTMVNSPGTIDSDYRGEVQLIVINLGQEPVVIQRGQRIAQMVVQRIIRARWQEVKVPSRFARTAGLATRTKITQFKFKSKKFNGRTKRASKS